MTVSAVVLAAGSSSRMGTIKPLVRIGGQTMLDGVLTMLRASRVSEIVVVLGNAADTIQQQVSMSGITVAINKSYADGMASSIRTGLVRVRHDAEAALIVLADQPLIRSSTVNLLIDEYRAKRPEIAVPIYRSFRGNPVLLNRSVFDEVAALTGDVGCRAIFGSHTHGILMVPVEDPAVLIDLDTAEDVHHFEEIRGRESAGSESLQFADLKNRDVTKQP